MNLQTQKHSDSEYSEFEANAEPIWLISHNPVQTSWLLKEGQYSFGRCRQGSERFGLPDPSLSKKHVKFHINGQPSLLEMGSLNGTWIDGKQLLSGQSVFLEDGMVIRLGHALFTLSFGQQAEADLPNPQLPGRSPKMQHLRARLEAARAPRRPVLLQGETGTGKEFAAHMLHAGRGPFVQINCGELQRGLSRAELFGTEPNTYTGAASQAKKGLVDQAKSGVLFLDEIGELDLEVQKELLHLLGTGRYRRLGGLKELRSSAWIIAATHDDLDKAVEMGKFRRDLLARLRQGGDSIHLPPLRERREDILLWLEIFAKEMGLELKLSSRSTGFLERLLLHSWPNNLRELYMILQEAAFKAKGRSLKSNHLPHQIRLAHRLARRGGLSHNSPPSSSSTPLESISLSKEEIIARLRMTRGNVAQTAVELSLERTKLYRLFKHHQIDYRGFRRRRRLKREESSSSTRPRS